MQKIFEAYLELLWNQFQYDVEVFGQKWIYFCLLIPAAIYFAFFILKWIVLTAPIWIPIKMIFTSLSRLILTAKMKIPRD